MTGNCLATLRGHTGEIVGLKFDMEGLYLGTCSMDHTAKLWDVETCKMVMNFVGHEGEVICI